MKSFVAGVSLFCLGALCAFAVLTPVNAEIANQAAKVGYVDLERSLIETPAGKRASASFERTLKQKQVELDRKQQNLQKNAAELDKQAPVMKPEVLRQRREQLQQQYVELQELYVKLERDLMAERTKLIQAILEKAAPRIKQVAQSEGYTMVLDRSAVLWADEADDLTARINQGLK